MDQKIGSHPSLLIYKQCTDIFHRPLSLRLSALAHHFRAGLSQPFPTCAPMFPFLFPFNSVHSASSNRLESKKYQARQGF